MELCCDGVPPGEVGFLIIRDGSNYAGGVDGLGIMLQYNYSIPVQWVR